MQHVLLCHNSIVAGSKACTIHPPQAVLLYLQMRSAVQSVAGLFPTSIISGRGREKVEGFIQLKELFYAGSHGMDIVGPQVCLQLPMLSIAQRVYAVASQDQVAAELLLHAVDGRHDQMQSRIRTFVKHHLSASLFWAPVVTLGHIGVSS